MRSGGIESLVPPMLVQAFFERFCAFCIDYVTGQAIPISNDPLTEEFTSNVKLTPFCVQLVVMSTGGGVDCPSKKQLFGDPQ